MQSILHKSGDRANRPSLMSSDRARFPQQQTWVGPVTRGRLIRILRIYGALYLMAILLFAGPFGDRAVSLAAGLLFPGGGFLTAFEAGGLVLSGATLALFMSALALWFATGNVLLAPLIWIGSSIIAAWLKAPDPSPSLAFLFLFGFGPCLLLAGLTSLFIRHARGTARRQVLNAFMALTPAAAFPETRVEKHRDDELGLEDLKALRLLLDRALQPVDAFQGFEWLDQFQTAAVRYQINFISYALSLTQSLYSPACRAQFGEAQTRLKAKQEDHRIWGYWALENLWGNLKRASDPVARDNIMYSGFVAAQLAYARNAGSSSPGPLQCKRGGHIEHSYELEEMVEVLCQQYKAAPFGLLPCEPNWIYPLCNAITATAIRAHDTFAGSAHWDNIAPRFRHFLETEFLTPGGKLIPFRSSYTGIAAPQIGGAVMQSFPCFFLNATLPDIAERQWLALQRDMKGKDWLSALWPVDVGNYRFSRASSFGATALAARELGDHDTADLLLQYFDAACPRHEQTGSVHYHRASLWAHTNVFMARIGERNMLRNLVTQPHRHAETGLHVSEASYPDVLVAKAIETKGALDLVLYPGTEKTVSSLTLSGLIPDAHYQMAGTHQKTFIAGRLGSASLDVSLSERTALRIFRKE